MAHPRSPLAPLLAACWLTAWAAPAAAFEFEFPWLEEPSSLQLTLTSIYAYHDDNYNRYADDDGYHDLRNRLNLKLTVDRFTFSGRFDSNTFIDAPAPSRNQYNPHYLDRYAPEKITAAYRGRGWRVVLGDFYATVGRGLALHLSKTDQIGEDTTLLGARGELRSGPLELELMSGLANPANQDLFGKALPETYDSISALQAGWRLGDGLRLGVHGVGFVYDPLQRNPRAQDEHLLPRWTTIAGVSFEALGLAERLDLYAEANWLGRQDRPAPNLEQDEPVLRHGWGAYASASLLLGDFNLTAEAKSLDDFAAYSLTWRGGGKYVERRLDYLRPPTLEPANMEVANNSDISGGRLQLDYRPGGGDSLLFAAYSGFWARDQQAAGNRWIYNLLLGFEQDFSTTGRARLTVGLREEVPQYAGGNIYHLLYAEAVVKLPLTRHHSLDLHSVNWFVHEGAGGHTFDFAKGELTVGYAWSPWLVLDVILGYDTFPSRAEDPYDMSVFYRREPGAPLERQLFLAGSATVDLWGSYMLRLLAGQTRGGVVCIGGVCRELPPFAGVRTELVLRF